MDQERVLTRRGREPSILSRNITMYRRAAGLTQEQCGARLNPPVPRNTVSRWENGRHVPERQNIVALALLFGVKIHQLFDPASWPEEAEEEEEDLADACAQ